MRVKFWGVRGSIPTADRRTLRYGGDTPCIEVRLANGTLIILDCGTGFRRLGQSLIEEFGEHPIHASIFLTHFHWDHIHGIPFFQPLYKEGNIFVFHAVTGSGLELKQVIESQLASPYFPVGIKSVKSIRHYRNLEAHSLNLNGAVVTFAHLNHPQGSVGYRIEADGGAFVLATDTEPGSSQHDRAVRELAQGADLLVYDAQYTPEQLGGERKGWGHSSWLEATRVARESGAKRLLLFHHDPESDDPYIDSLVEKARREFPHVAAAAEDLEIQIPNDVFHFARTEAPSERRREHRYRLELPVWVGWKGLGGEKRAAKGLARDLSKTGIYFLAPTHVDTSRPIELKLVLPSEITHRGELTFHYLAIAIRKSPVTETLGASLPAVGVAARLTSGGTRQTLVT